MKTVSFQNYLLRPSPGFSANLDCYRNSVLGFCAVTEDGSVSELTGSFGAPSQSADTEPGRYALSGGPPSAVAGHMGKVISRMGVSVAKPGFKQARVLWVKEKAFCL